MDLVVRLDVGAVEVKAVHTGVGNDFLVNFVPKVDWGAVSSQKACVLAQIWFDVLARTYGATRPIDKTTGHIVIRQLGV